MLPRAAWSAPATLVKNRMAFVFVPIGAIMEHWTPARDGAEYELSKTLMPLREVQQDILVLSNFVHDKARPHGDGGGDHDRDPATFLTGAHARKSQTDIFIGQSVDQYAAERIGAQTSALSQLNCRVHGRVRLLPSLEFSAACRLGRSLA